MLSARSPADIDSSTWRLLAMAASNAMPMPWWTRTRDLVMRNAAALRAPVPVGAALAAPVPEEEGDSSGGHGAEPLSIGGPPIQANAGYAVQNLEAQTRLAISCMQGTLDVTSNAAYAAMPRSGGVFTGDVTVTGSLVTLEPLQLGSNVITLNATLGRDAVPPPDLLSGIVVNRGAESDYLLLLDEGRRLFKVGTRDDMQAVCTRDDDLPAGFPYFDAGAGKLVARTLTPSDVAGLQDALHDLDASCITSGALDPARIPTLDASKISTGVFGSNQVPPLDAAKIATGVLAVARVPTTLPVLAVGALTATTTAVLPSAGAPAPSAGAGPVFYVDAADGDFKSVSAAGRVTTYNPMAAAGDLAVHGGTTTLRLPVGAQGTVLAVDANLFPATGGVGWRSTCFQYAERTSTIATTTSSALTTYLTMTTSAPLPAGTYSVQVSYQAYTAVKSSQLRVAANVDSDAPFHDSTMTLASSTGDKPIISDFKALTFAGTGTHVISVSFASPAGGTVGLQNARIAIVRTT